MDFKERMVAGVDRTVAKYKKFSEIYGDNIMYAPNYEEMTYVAKSSIDNKLLFRGEMVLLAMYDKERNILIWEKYDENAPKLCKETAPDVKVLYENSKESEVFNMPYVAGMDKSIALCLVAYVFDYFGGEQLVTIDDGRFLHYLGLKSINKC